MFATEAGIPEDGCQNLPGSCCLGTPRHEKENEMAAITSDIFSARPASERAAVVQNGRPKQPNVCDHDYAQLTRRQRDLSALESLFRGGPFYNLFDPGTASSQSKGSVPLARPDRDSVGPQYHFSEQAKEILQHAAEHAVQYGKCEVDTEHLLYELPRSEAVQAIVKQFNISVDDLCGPIGANFPVGAQSEPPGGQIAVSPRVKARSTAPHRLPPAGTFLCRPRARQLC
ncbi:hypothetical protein [Rhizobium sp. P28RR-XV]|uniref:hypothetical protein n=1 Tax=Rhizobium sp. P28RR-XV TaxID=2726737 RepID=UPI001457427E|nr:hypothetical protein [Rhizobium sp. P28RR-XV]NLR86353.1 hypothetical protein [Rhizobium sp. P28RR-XV]